MSRKEPRRTSARAAYPPYRSRRVTGKADPDQYVSGADRKNLLKNLVGAVTVDMSHVIEKKREVEMHKRG